MTTSKDLATKIQTATAPTNGQTKAKTVADDLAVYLSRPEVKAQIATALPKHVTADRLARIALTTVRTNTELQKCNVSSLVGAIMQAAQLGLEPGLLGHCYLVPFNRKIKEQGKPDRWVKDVQFIIGYKGLLDLARRAGGIVTIAAELICENDIFEYRKGYEEVLSHQPNFRDRGTMIGVYAYATTKDGGRYAVVMTKLEVDKIRERSKAKDNGPWITDYEEMAKKTAIRRLTKYLPMSVELAENLEVDQQREMGFGEGIETISLNVKGPETPALPEVEEVAEVFPGSTVVEASEGELVQQPEEDPGMKAESMTKNKSPNPPRLF
jgi:recombination protein RecT